MPFKPSLVPRVPVPKSEGVRQRIKSVKRDAMLECRCGGREMIEVKSGVLLKNGKPQGGTKQMICALCLAKGERLVVA